MNRKVVENWYELKNEGAAPELLIYGFIGQYDEVSFAGFSGAIKNLSTNELTVRIHSGGGSVFDGLPIYDALKASGLDITVIIDGMAASMASVISQVASKGKRKIQKSGNLMIHRVKGAEYGNADEMRAYADMMDVQEKKIKAVFIESTGQTEEVVNSWFAKGVDFWIDAEMALKLGLVDQVIEGKADRLPVNKLKQMGEEAAFNALTNSLPDFHLQNRQTDMKLQVLIMSALATHGISVLENATEEQTAQHVINALKAKDDKITELSNTILTNKTAQVDALIARAKTEGKLKADDAEGEKDLKELAVVNMAMAQKFVDKMPGTTTTPNNVVINVGTQNSANAADANDRENWTYADYAKKDPKALAAMQDTDSEKFLKLQNGLKA